MEGRRRGKKNKRKGGIKNKREREKNDRYAGQGCFTIKEEPQGPLTKLWLNRITSANLWLESHSRYSSIDSYLLPFFFSLPSHMPLRNSFIPRFQAWGGEPSRHFRNEQQSLLLLLPLGKWNGVLLKSRAGKKPPLTLIPILGSRLRYQLQWGRRLLLIRVKWIHLQMMPFLFLMNKSETMVVHILTPLSNSYALGFAFLHRRYPDTSVETQWPCAWTHGWWEKFESSWYCGQNFKPGSEGKVWTWCCCLLVVWSCKNHLTSSRWLFYL